jgi:hypothetical protein
MKSLCKFILVFLLCAPGFASATFAEDKEICYNYSNNLGLFAELRDENLPRDTLIDRTLNLAGEKEWSNDATLLLIYMIQYVYANPDIKPAVMKKVAYDSCMKKRGYSDA